MAETKTLRVRRYVSKEAIRYASGFSPVSGAYREARRRLKEAGATEITGSREERWYDAGIPPQYRGVIVTVTASSAGE